MISLMEVNPVGNIGNRIKKLRKYRNLTQQQLAAQVNVSSQVVSNWEREYSNPDHDDISRLAKVLEVSADYILFGEQLSETTDQTKKQPSDFERLFLAELRELNEEGKQKALEHVRYLRYLQDQKTN